MNHRISAPSDGASTALAQLTDYDMVDLPARASPRDRADVQAELEGRWPGLRTVLEAVDERVYPIYHAADRGALRARNWHWRIVRFAAVTGTAAVMMSIFELWELSDPSRKPHQPLPLQLVGRLLELVGRDPSLAGGGVELVLAIAALASVAVGVFAAWHTGWLYQRFTAEQCRIIKFRFLLDPVRWRGKDAAAIREELTKDLENLRLPRGASCCTAQHIKHWVLRRFSPPLPHPELTEFNEVPEQLDGLDGQIVAYCRAKRLLHEANYFESQAHRRETREKWSRYVVPGAFLLSIIAASLHFSLDFNGVEARHSNVPGWWSRFLMMIAALLPVAAACVRTLRTAQEFGRNSLRFHALNNELRDLNDRLDRKAGTDRLGVLRCAESALEVEHRAWMRLMMEAEWFG